MAVDYMGAAWGWACVRDEHLRALRVNIEYSRTVNSVSIFQTVLHAPSSRHVSRIHTHTHIPQVLCSGSLEKILLKQSQRDFFIVGLIRAFNVLIGM